MRRVSGPVLLPSRRRRPRGIAARFAVASLAVVAVALGIVGVGVVVVGGQAFAALMIQHGSSAAVAHQMFDSSVGAVFGLAAIVAAAICAGLALLLAARLSAPLADLAGAAGRVARGDYAARVPPRGPAELISLAESFNLMAAGLEAQERVRRDFVINASHELRTPLTNLQGYLEALRDGVVEPDAPMFESLREEVERLARLARSLESLAEAARPPAASTAPLLDPAPLVSPASPVDLTGIVRSSVELSQPAFARAAITLQLEVSERLTVRAEPDQLAQVLANLLQNAARYTPAGGRVIVQAAARPEGVVVSVANSGPDIPAEDLPRVFERFYRVEKSRDRAQGGAGIGLAIVKEIVEGSGGRVGAESSQGTTRFWFNLPAVSRARPLNPARRRGPRSPRVESMGRRPG